MEIMKEVSENVVLYNEIYSDTSLSLQDKLKIYNTSSTSDNTQYISTPLNFKSKEDLDFLRLLVKNTVYEFKQGDNVYTGLINFPTYHFKRFCTEIFKEESLIVDNVRKIDKANLVIIPDLAELVTDIKNILLGKDNPAEIYIAKRTLSSSQIFVINNYPVYKVPGDVIYEQLPVELVNSKLCLKRSKDEVIYKLYYNNSVFDTAESVKRVVEDIEDKNSVYFMSEKQYIKNITIGKKVMSFEEYINITNIFVSKTNNLHDIAVSNLLQYDFNEEYNRYYGALIYATFKNNIINSGAYKKYQNDNIFSISGLTKFDWIKAKINHLFSNDDMNTDMLKEVISYFYTELSTDSRKREHFLLIVNGKLKEYHNKKYDTVYKSININTSNLSINLNPPYFTISVDNTPKTQKYGYLGESESPDSNDLLNNTPHASIETEQEFIPF